MKYEILTRTSSLEQSHRKMGFIVETLTDKIENSMCYAERAEDLKAIKELEEYLICLNILNDYITQVEDEAEMIRLCAEKMED